LKTAHSARHEELTPLPYLARKYLIEIAGSDDGCILMEVNDAVSSERRFIYM